MSSHNRRVRRDTGRSGAARRDQLPHSTDTPAASAPPETAATNDADGENPADATGRGTSTPSTTPVLGMVGPTSEATRQWVAESRKRQGLSPQITDPVALESLALFLRNAIDSLDHDRRDDNT